MPHHRSLVGVVRHQKKSQVHVGSEPPPHNLVGCCGLASEAHTLSDEDNCGVCVGVCVLSIG